jgi:uncharacterized phage protein gp47/JayE
MTYGLSATGFLPKTIDDIIPELEESYRGTFGQDIDLDESSPYGQQIAIDSEREAAVWALAQALYDAFDPANAEDDQLDGVCRITGAIREGATYSTMTVRCYGTAGTVLPVSRVVSVASTGVRFASIAEGTIAVFPSDEYADVVFQAEETGPKVALAGALTIETPVAGWDTAENLEDADVGQDRETDTDLRVRRESEMRTASNAALEAIRARVLTLTDQVVACHVFMNCTEVTDGDGLPPHSVEVVVLLGEGADEEDVRAAVFAAVGGGIQSYGSNSGTVEDSAGTLQTVCFSEAAAIDIYVSCAITYDATEYPADGDTLVRDALLTYGSTYTMGRDVQASRLIMALKDIPGILAATVLVGTTNPPASASVTITVRQIADFDSSRITVTSVAGAP